MDLVKDSPESPSLSTIAIVMALAPSACRPVPRTWPTSVDSAKLPGWWEPAALRPGRPTQLAEPEHLPQGRSQARLAHHGPSGNNCPPSHINGRHTHRPSADGGAVADSHTDLLPIIAALAAADESTARGFRSLVRTTPGPMRTPAPNTAGS